LRGWFWPGGSGPRVAGLFQRLLGLCSLIAWLSLASQVRLLIGPHGLLPLRRLLEVVTAEGPLPILGFPSLLRWPALTSDGVLLGGSCIGASLSVLAMIGVWPRLALGLSTVLYLSYTSAGQTFFSFQWDIMLLECGLLVLFLPADRAAPVAHLAFRCLLFKLYFESGIAKWQSSIHDWQDGSAMTFYYETAPLPAGLAHLAHNLPAWWHHFESRAVLALELVVPFGIFGPRRVRLGAAVVLTLFQLFNIATANYGFFCYLTLSLHVFLLDDEDLRRLPASLFPPPSDGGRWPRAASWSLLGAYLLASLLEGAAHFTEGGIWLDRLREPFQALHLVNAYHLFGSITRQRIEPEPEVQVERAWKELHLWHKPGDPTRRPDYVAPHQPRVDFQLWFHGLRPERSLYVSSLLRHLCDDPDAVQPLFRERLPRASAARMAYWQYHFTTRAERRATGRWWKRTLVGYGPAVPCDR
jgi:hypothetical protein